MQSDVERDAAMLEDAQQALAGSKRRDNEMAERAAVAARAAEEERIKRREQLELEKGIRTFRR